MKAEVSDILVDLDFALSKVGIGHRDMELVDAYYMINRHNEMVSDTSTGSMEP